jgi:hypothetical protein
LTAFNPRFPSRDDRQRHAAGPRKFRGTRIIPTTPRPTTRPISKALISVNAVRAAELSSIQEDLFHVNRCCALLHEKALTDGWATDVVALFDSIGIRYRRCFTKNSVRKPLNVDDLRCMKGHALERHNYVLAVTDTHIAHSVNGFELYFTPIYLAPNEDGSFERTYVGYEAFRAQAWGTLDIRKFGEDVGAWGREVTGLWLATSALAERGCPVERR